MQAALRTCMVPERPRASAIPARPACRRRLPTNKRQLKCQLIDLCLRSCILQSARERLPSPIPSGRNSFSPNLARLLVCLITDDETSSMADGAALADTGAAAPPPPLPPPSHPLPFCLLPAAPTSWDPAIADVTLNVRLDGCIVPSEASAEGARISYSHAGVRRVPAASAPAAAVLPRHGRLSSPSCHSCRAP